MEDQILDEGFKRTGFTLEERREINRLKLKLNPELKALKAGQTTLFLMSGLAILGMILGLAINPYNVDSVSIIIEGIILASIYGACGVLMSKNPKVALIVGLVVYLLVILLSAFVDPATIISGILVKLFILLFLGKAISAAFSYEYFRDKLKALGIPKYELNMIKEFKKLSTTL